MPSDNPPTYETAVSTAPAVSVTDPSGAAIPSNTANGVAAGGGLDRAVSHAPTSGSDGLGVDINDDDARSMDDERRSLPKGWVRCFDPKTQHHFYVDEATKRATWLHPYDDPEFLRTLPKSNPAHPDSAQARAARARAEAEDLAMKKTQEARDLSRDRKDSKKLGNGDVGSGGSSPSSGEEKNGNGIVKRNGETEERNWFQRKKDKLIGTKEEREQAKRDKQKKKDEEMANVRSALQAYEQRRQDLLNGQLNDPHLRSMYAADPFMYPAPTTAFSRSGGLVGNPYGYGYPGGYGRRYNGMGYGTPLLWGTGGLMGGMMMGSMIGGGGFGEAALALGW
ncbi:hypothetical protein EHS25_006001 [Saitozyma podzolica]|uniref:WW domain-containing protein n=1 Tax=Saitozyma podzolica TaxID=1890683 RepID=A0A427XU75_9TREE|nr:hypothetical protein EHS25_006001 [Saitozyma podzolica]